MSSIMSSFTNSVILKTLWIFCLFIGAFLIVFNGTDLRDCLRSTATGRCRLFSENRSIPSVVTRFDLSVRDAISPSVVCTLIRFPRGTTTPICLFPPDDDLYLSAVILRVGSYEPQLTTIVELILDLDRDLDFLDFGSNVGVYSLLALKMGRRVVAVDPSVDNLKRLRKSIQLGRFATDCAELLLNALSDERGVLKFEHDPINNGASSVAEQTDVDKQTDGDKQTDRDKQMHGDKQTDGDTNHNNATYVNAITLTDLASVITFKRAFMKIDVQGYEARTFTKLAEFLKRVDVPFIMMEWVWIKRGSSGRYLVRLMAELGYVCHNLDTSLKPNARPCKGHHLTWGFDVFWVRENSSVYAHGQLTGATWTEACELAQIG